MGKGPQSINDSSVARFHLTSDRQEGGKFLMGCERLQIQSSFDLFPRDWEGPLAIMLIRLHAHPVGALKVHPCGAVVPADEEVGFGRDQFQRIPEATSHRRNEDRHRGAGSQFLAGQQPGQKHIIGVLIKGAVLKIGQTG